MQEIYDAHPDKPSEVIDELSLVMALEENDTAVLTELFEKVDDDTIVSQYLFACSTCDYPTLTLYFKEVLRRDLADHVDTAMAANIASKRGDALLRILLNKYFRKRDETPNIFHLMGQISTGIIIIYAILMALWSTY